MAAALDVLAAEASTSPWRRIGHAVVGLTHAARGESEPARTSVDTGVEIGRGAGQAVPQISGLANSAAWSTELGDWDRAGPQRRVFAQACWRAGLSRALDLRRGTFRSGAAIGALERARRGAGSVTTAWLLTHLVRLLVTCDDPAGARRCLDEARAALAGAPDAAGVGEMVALAERQLESRGRAGAADEGLSERELDVLRLLATDLTQREIGPQLYRSFNTVKSHTRSIFRKLGVSGREQAVVRARAQLI